MNHSDLQLLPRAQQAGAILKCRICGCKLDAGEGDDTDHASSAQKRGASGSLPHLEKAAWQHPPARAPSRRQSAR
jgi:hypothetical protein